MRKISLLLFCVAGITVGSGTTVTAQDLKTIVEKIKIIAIQSMQEREEGSMTYLDITAAVANTNPMPVKLRNRRLEFFIGTLQRNPDGSEVREKGRRLGRDAIRSEMTLEAELTLGQEVPEGINQVTFQVNMGANDAEICRLFRHILTCLGNPAEQAPLLSIDGTVEIGTYIPEHNRWEFDDGAIEWQLIPHLQPRFLLYFGGAELTK